MNRRSKYLQRRAHGQAMTELLIAATAILVPLFLIVPAFGKFIEMRQATIQAARYEAWEYTVWHAQDCDRGAFDALSSDPEECPMSGFDEARLHALPVKSYGKTRAESIARFYQRPDRTGTGLAVVANGAAPDQIPANFIQWSDHAGQPMISQTIGSDQLFSKSPSGLPVIDTLLDIVLGTIKTVFGLFGTALKFLNDIAGSDAPASTFDAINPDGLIVAKTSLTMNSQAIQALMTSRNGPALPDLTFTGSAAVLTDGWNAGGREQTYKQASGMVGTSVFKSVQNLPGLSLVWDVITAILAPELRKCGGPVLMPNYPLEKSGLWFGHVDSEAIHRDRLLDSDGNPVGTHTCDAAGRCDFDDTFTREKACIE